MGARDELDRELVDPDDRRRRSESRHLRRAARPRHRVDVSGSRRVELAIRRGMQILNVAFGGTLGRTWWRPAQATRTGRSSAGSMATSTRSTSSRARWRRRRWASRSKSLAATITRPSSVSGAGVVTGRAASDAVEAIELAGGPWALGVQRLQRLTTAAACSGRCSTPPADNARAGRRPSGSRIRSDPPPTPRARRCSRPAPGAGRSCRT